MSHEWSSGTLLGRNAWHGMANVADKPPTSVAEVLTWFGAPDDYGKPGRPPLKCPISVKSLTSLLTVSTVEYKPRGGADYDFIRVVH